MGMTQSEKSKKYMEEIEVKQYILFMPKATYAQTIGAEK